MVNHKDNGPLFAGVQNGYNDSMSSFRAKSRNLYDRVGACFENGKFVVEDYYFYYVATHKCSTKRNSNSPVL